jgi:hypothetical protein
MSKFFAVYVIPFARLHVLCRQYEATHPAKPRWVRVRYSRMSKWNPIISGGCALATPGDLARRWCLDVGSRPCRRVTANGFRQWARSISSAARASFGVFPLSAGEARSEAPATRSAGIAPSQPVVAYSAASTWRWPKWCRQRSIHSLLSFSWTPFCDRRRCSASKSTRSISWSWL